MLVHPAELQHMQAVARPLLTGNVEPGLEGQEVGCS